MCVSWTGFKIEIFILCVAVSYLNAVLNKAPSLHLRFEYYLSNLLALVSTSLWPKDLGAVGGRNSKKLRLGTSPARRRQLRVYSLVLRRREGSHCRNSAEQQRTTSTPRSTLSRQMKSAVPVLAPLETMSTPRWATTHRPHLACPVKEDPLFIFRVRSRQRSFRSNSHHYVILS